jgi:hypothetical protein
MGMNGRGDLRLLKANPRDAQVGTELHHLLDGVIYRDMSLRGKEDAFARV